MAGMAGATILISLIYIFLLRWLTKPLLYTSMVLILAGFVLLGGWCWMKRSEYDPVKEEQNHMYATYGAAASWIIGAIYLCFICCCWKNIALGASIMECASAFVTSNIRVIFLPICAYLICIPFIAYWMVTAVFLYSTGEPEYAEKSFIANISWEDKTRYMWWYFVFALLWCIAFFICLQQFMIASTVCQWYWSG